MKFDVWSPNVKFHLSVFILSASGGQKPQFLANFDFWGRLDRFIQSINQSKRIYIAPYVAGESEARVGLG